jgi:hypothetical protein
MNRLETPEEFAGRMLREGVIARTPPPDNNTPVLTSSEMSVDMRADAAEFCRRLAAALDPED